MKLVAEEGAEFGVSCSYGDPDGPIIDVGGVKTPPLERRYYNLEDRVASMDEQGVNVHALSLTQPMVYWAAADLSRRLSEAYNDSCVAAHEAYPERFLGLAMLPMQEPAMALAELERVASLPGIRGVYMATRVLDRELSDSAFFPVYEAIEDRGLTIFLHPVKVVDPTRLRKFYLTNV